MSVKIMAAVYDSDLSDVYDVAVMLALANHADDEGRCYPSVRRISELARCSERKAQNVIKGLQDRGYLRIDQQAGPRGVNVFYVIPTPAHCAPPHDVHPAQRAPHPRTACTPPPHTVHPTPAQRAPEPSINHQETSEKRQTRDVHDALEAFAGSEAVASFIAFRRKMKKPLTLTGAKRLAKTLDEIRKLGGDPDDALALAEERGWQSIKADWYFKETGNDAQPSHDASRPHQPHRGQAHGRSRASTRRSGHQIASEIDDALGIGQPQAVRRWDA